MNHEAKFACTLFPIALIAMASILAQQPALQQSNPPAPTAPLVKKPSAPLKKNPPRPVPTPKPQALTVNGIVSMVQAGLSEDVVIARLRKDDKAFDLSPEDLIKLKQAGVGNDTLKVMMDPKTDLRPTQVASPPPTAAILPSIPTPSPGPAAAAGSPSSAVGSSGKASDDGDAAAALGPAAEIGVYFKKANLWTEVLPEVVNWKTGGTLKNLASAGVVKKDLNGNLTGPGSRNSIKSPLEFLIVAANGVSITEYQLIRLRINKDYREFRTVTGGILNQQSGAMRDMVPFEGKKLSPRTFSVVLPNNLGAGEYGFLTPGAMGSSGNSQAQIGKMYTFHFIE